VTGKQWETVLEGWLKALPVAWFRNEPKMQGRIKVSGGTPDYTALLAAKAHLIECKLETSTAFTLGNLAPPVSGAAEGSGITSKQANTLTDWERHGGHGWIAARLEVPALAPRGKQAKLLDAGRKEQVIQRLVPWADWRRLLLGGTRSVPYAEFEMLGLPLRSPDDLLRALQSARLDAPTTPRLQ
jgi:hypothetical protein